nr:unnamed protein product [Spirometra erinaceieuropaei]
MQRVIYNSLSFYGETAVPSDVGVITKVEVDTKHGPPVFIWYSEYVKATSTSGGVEPYNASNPTYDKHSLTIPNLDAQYQNQLAVLLTDKTLWT